MKRKLFAMLVVVVVVATLEACGSSGDSSAVGVSQERAVSAREKKLPPFYPPEAEAALILVDKVPGVGQVLVESAHKTLYRFSKDKRGSGTTNCYGACSEPWFPKPSGHTPFVKHGARASLAGTIKRRDGVVQATYAGWPLYTYIGEGPLKVNGGFKRTFGGVFYPLRVDGSTVYHKEP